MSNDLTKAAQAAADYIERRWQKAGATDDGLQEQFTALRAALAAQQDAQPVAFLVVDRDGQLMHAAAWREAAHEHINDAINEHDLDEAKHWKVIPAYAAAAQPQQATRAITTPDREELRLTRIRLKSGEYDGNDIIRAWIAIDRLLAG